MNLAHDFIDKIRRASETRLDTFSSDAKLNRCLIFHTTLEKHQAKFTFAIQSEIGPQGRERLTVEPINQNSLVRTPKTANSAQTLHGGIQIHASQLEDQLTSRNGTRGTEAMAFLSTKRRHGLTQQRRHLLVAFTQQ